MKEVMVHMYIEKQNRFPYLSFAHVFLILWRKAEFIYLWWLLGITKMAGHSYPVSLGSSRGGMFYAGSLRGNSINLRGE